MGFPQPVTVLGCSGAEKGTGWREGDREQAQNGRRSEAAQDALSDRPFVVAVAALGASVLLAAGHWGRAVPSQRPLGIF